MSGSIRAALHAIAGCAGAASTGGDCTSAAAGSAATVALNNLIGADTTKMTAEQKQAYSNLMGALVAGVTAGVGGDAAAAQLASKVEVENNLLGRRDTNKYIIAKKACDNSMGLNSAQCRIADDLKKKSDRNDAQLLAIARKLKSGVQLSDADKALLKDLNGMTGGGSGNVTLLNVGNMLAANGAIRNQNMYEQLMGIFSPSDLSALRRVDSLYSDYQETIRTLTNPQTGVTGDTPAGDGKGTRFYVDPKTYSPETLVKDAYGRVMAVKDCGGVTECAAAGLSLASGAVFGKQLEDGLGVFTPGMLAEGAAVKAAGAATARAEGAAARAEANAARVENNANVDTGVNAYADDSFNLGRTEYNSPVSNAHFDTRHGASTTLEQQFERATSGLQPNGAPGRAVDASRAFSDDSMLEAIRQAEATYATNPTVYNRSEGVSITFERPIGEGFTKKTPINPTKYVVTNTITVKIDSTTGKAVTAYPNITDKYGVIKSNPLAGRGL